VKQHLAALRMLFDWLGVGHTLNVNPAHAVRGPKHVVKKSRTPVLATDKARVLLNTIDTGTLVGLRDRALIALMAYTFARIGAAVGMRVEDYYVQGRRGWVRLYEKGGKQHEVPANYNLDEFLEAYINGAGLGSDPKRFLFCTAKGKTDVLTDRPHESIGRVPDGSQAGHGRGHQDENRKLHFRGDWHYRLPEKWR
jgi:site-specific recombinase XerC